MLGAGFVCVWLMSPNSTCSDCSCDSLILWTRFLGVELATKWEKRNPKKYELVFLAHCSALHDEQTVVPSVVLCISPPLGLCTGSPIPCKFATRNFMLVFTAFHSPLLGWAKRSPRDHKGAQFSRFWGLIEVLVDVCFAVDILLTFRTTYCHLDSPRRRSAVDKFWQVYSVEG